MLDSKRRHEPIRVARWSRWMLLAAAALTSAVLVTTAWLGYGSVAEASRLLARGQGESVLEQVRRELLALERPATQDDLERILDLGEARGLRYVALMTEHHGTLETGERLGTAPALQEPLARSGSFEVAELGERVRLTAYSRTRKKRVEVTPAVDAAPRDAGVAEAPAAGGLDAGVGAVPEPPRLPPDLFLEFEPVVANQLAQRATITLGTSLAAAALLVFGALVAVRWLAARDREAEARVRERQLASVGALSAVLAHEIRNPLASLKGNAQLLAETLAGSPQQSRVDRVVSEAVRLEQLTTGLLDFVRTGEIHRRPTSPAAVITAAAAEVGADRHGIRIDLDTSAAPETWSLDPERLQQVLSNVLRNAVQAAPSGSAIDVRAWSEAGRLHLRVRDRGPGIPPGQEETIFEPFHTSKVRGTGLGLAVARWVVDLHGGAIRASNHPDGGALIDVAIPE
jgi:two-component system, NtrC family, sensor histidine kinase HydH